VKYSCTFMGFCERCGKIDPGIEASPSNKSRIKAVRMLVIFKPSAITSTRALFHGSTPTP